MQFGRVTNNNQKPVSAAWLEEYSKGGLARKKLFQMFVQNDCNPFQTELSLKRTKERESKLKRVYSWMTRAQLLQIHPQSVVDFICANKIMAN